MDVTMFLGVAIQLIMPRGQTTKIKSEVREAFILPKAAKSQDGVGIGNSIIN
jgi:hypothetical protein